MLKISLLIPTKERPVDLKACFDSLAKQTYKNFETIIVDASVSGDTENLCGDYASALNIKYIRQKRDGFVGAVLDGFPEVAGDIFTRTDDDIIADPGWLQEINKTFSISEDIGGVTGPALIPEDRLSDRDLIKFNLKLRYSKNIFSRTLRILYHDYIMEKDPFAVARFFKSGAFSLGSGFSHYLKSITEPIEVDYLESCNWSVRKSLLDKIGGFDPRFIGVGDYFEADAAYKIKGLGYKMLFSPDVKIRHMVSKVGAFGSRSHSYARSRNFILFYYRHIKPNSIGKIIRFMSYLFLMNSYFIFSFLKTGNASHLGGIYGTADGMIRYLPEVFFYNSLRIKQNG